MKVQAGPGYVVYQRMTLKEEKSAGGIVLAKPDEKMTAECVLGRCIDSGEHVATGRTGRLGGGNAVAPRGWLRPGAIFELKPVSEKPTRLAPGIYTCTCEQICAVWNELPDGVELEEAKV